MLANTKEGFATLSWAEWELNSSKIFVRDLGQDEIIYGSVILLVCPTQSDIILNPNTNRAILSTTGNKAIFDLYYTPSEGGVLEEQYGHSALMEFGYHLYRDEDFPNPEALYHNGADMRLRTVVREKSQSHILLVGENSLFTVDVECRLPWRSISMLTLFPGYENSRYRLGMDRIVAIQVRESADVL